MDADEDYVHESAFPTIEMTPTSSECDVIEATDPILSGDVDIQALFNHCLGSNPGLKYHLSHVENQDKSGFGKWSFLHPGGRPNRGIDLLVGR